jgi:atypical dual specificity phosphatase
VGNGLCYHAQLDKSSCKPFGGMARFHFGDSMKRWLARSIFGPTFAYNYLLGRIFRVRSWWNRVDEHVILGALPLARDAQALKAEGVTGVVNMCEEYRGPIAKYEELGIDQLWLPTIDFTHPADALVERGAEFIESHAKKGGTVYVHCKAGRARSATIVLWWLVRYRGLSPEAAQQLLLLRRPHINPKVYLRPVIQRLYQKFQSDKQ